MTEPLWSDEQEKPIQHIRVIDLSIFLPGPMVTRLLAQHGAEVIKIEKIPEGDPLRQVSSTKIFELLNQGKRSAAINLKSEEGTALVKQLAAEADVFVENFREGVTDSLGLGYAELSEQNPDLIYLSIRGSRGKFAEYPAHDINFIATSGVGEWFLESPNYSTHFADIVGGALVPTMKLLFHLANPARRGMHIVSYLNEGFRSLYLPRAFDACFQDSQPENERKSYGIHYWANGTFAFSRFYKCRDGQFISLQAVQPKEWETFCDAVDRPQWKQRAFDKSLGSELEKMFLEAPTTYWEVLNSNQNGCLFRVVPWTEHFKFSEARQQLESDPFSWVGFLPNQLAKAPRVGEDTLSILEPLGVPAKELAEWLSRGVIAQAK